MENSNYVIEEASEDDFLELITLFQKENFVLKSEKTLRWKYSENPAGKSKIFVVKDNNGQILGTLVYSPRRFIIPNVGEIMMMQAVDAMFAKELRGKKQYTKILQHSMEKIPNPMYTFPNGIAEKAERKCGWEVLSDVQRWIFPINVGNRIRIVRDFHLLRHPVNFLSKIYSHLRLGSASNRIILKPITKFSYNYDDMDEVFSGERTADYLNWRFCHNPLKEYHCFEFYKDNQRIGYCVISIKGSSADIFDFCAKQNKKGCIKKLVEYCRELDIATLAYDNVKCELKHLGFLKTKANSRVLVYKFPYNDIKMNYADSDWDFV